VLVLNIDNLMKKNIKIKSNARIITDKVNIILFNKDIIIILIILNLWRKN